MQTRFHDTDCRSFGTVDNIDRSKGKQAAANAAALLPTCARSHTYRKCTASNPPPTSPAHYALDNACPTRQLGRLSPRRIPISNVAERVNVETRLSSDFPLPRPIHSNAYSLFRTRQRNIAELTRWHDETMKTKEEFETNVRLSKATCARTGKRSPFE